jgi:gamma-glutamylcyclotransferase (GGCT)/AIG2-like uncharacterized protein YtfP
MMAEDCPPPLSPPLPATSDSPRQIPTIKHSSKVSPLIQKLQRAPQGHEFESRTPREPIDTFAPRCGPYFFYGTLMDPQLLSEILSLSEIPTLHPTKIIGYSLKLWGQYPALVDGETGEAVEGMVYHVDEPKHAERLAEYETNAYWPAPCLINVMEGEHSAEIRGTTFKYIGNPMDTSDGTFDLNTWLKRMNRQPLEKPRVENEMADETKS